MRALWLLLWALAINVLIALAPAQAQNLIRNGDFETEAAQNPPPGWTMWGADQWKIPQNYQRDTQNAHGGKASLRIHHPANTRGYIVASPGENIITVEKGRTYTLSFWAKSDRPGTSFFHVQGFSGLNPMVSGTSPLQKTLTVDTTWRQFTYRLTESLDFLAEDAAYLMLAFSATQYQNAAEERTLWIDDVVVEAGPTTPNTIKLLSLKTIDYTPIEHRLQPGATLSLTIDAKNKTRRATREAGGVSFHRVNGYMQLPYNRQGEYKLTPEQEATIRAMRLPLTRFYALGDETFSLESALDKAAHVMNRTGIPQENSVLEFETQGARTKLAPEVWARGVEHSLKQGYKFRFWEISNEPWIHRPDQTPAFPTPQDYVAHVQAVAPAIRRVQPNGQIGIGLHVSDLAWGNYILKAAAGHYDFVAGHWYSFIDVSKYPFEAIVAGENYRILDQMQRFNALMRAYNPGRPVYQYDTEWSLHSGAGGSAGSTVQNGNIVGTLHRAVRLIYYLREDIVKGASAWEMFSNAGPWNSLGLLPPDSDKKSMVYWVHRLANEHTGEWVLDMQGTTPYYQPDAAVGPQERPLRPGPLAPVVTMLSQDEKSLTIIAANASWTQSIPCAVSVQNFPIAAAEAQIISHSDPKAPPLLEKKEDLVSNFPVQINGTQVNCTLPPHSVVFIKLTRRQ